MVVSCSGDAVYCYYFAVRDAADVGLMMYDIVDYDAGYASALDEAEWIAGSVECYDELVGE